MLEQIKSEIFTTDGRINRLRYIKYTFAIAISLAAISFILTLALGENSTFGKIAEFIIYIPFAVGSIMLQIRRLHDLDKSGWLVLLQFIPGINVLFSLYLLFFKGTDGTNTYGYDPLLMDSDRR